MCIVCVLKEHEETLNSVLDQLEDDSQKNTILYSYVETKHKEIREKLALILQATMQLTFYPYYDPKQGDRN